MTVAAVFYCTECFEAVKMTEAEAIARVDGGGGLICDRCKPLSDLVDRLADLAAARESRRLWAAMMIARDVKTLDSIRRGLPVHRSRVDVKALVRAGRGAPTTTSKEWVVVTADMLDAIDEAGPFR